MLRRFAGTIRGVPFNIENISKELWLDASDSSTIDGTTSVTEWRDKSPNNRDFTSVVSPSYDGTKVIFRRDVLLKDNNPITTSSGEVWAVISWLTPDVNRWFFAQGDSSIPDGDSLTFGMSPSDQVINYYLSGTNSIITSETFTAGTKRIIRFKKTSASNNAEIEVNNTETTESTSGSVGWFDNLAGYNRLVLGADAGSNLFNKGDFDLYELIVTTDVLSQSDADSMYDYLLNKH